MDQIFFPDYTHSILNITNTILHYYGVKTPYADLDVLTKALKRRPKNVILLILDGMGVDLISKTLPKTAFLRKHIRDEISSVFPPTTTTATTTYYSGLPPACHGWIGWSPYFKECDRCVEFFSNLDTYSREPVQINVRDLVPYTHIFEKIKKASPKVQLTRVFPDKISFKEQGIKGAFTFTELARNILRQSKAPGEQFILSYWTEPDHACHHYGTYSKAVKRKIKFFNQKIEAICAQMKDTVIIISADHGHIPTKEFFYINDYPELMEMLAHPISLEDRAAAIFLKKGYDKAFLAFYRKHLSRHFVLMSGQEIIQKGLLGHGKMHPKVKDFLGDYVLIATGGVVLRDRIKDGQGFALKSAHAGLNPKEMIVPLIVVDR